MNTPEERERIMLALRQADEILRQEWIAAGKTEAELDQEDQIFELYDELLAAGKDPDKIHAE